MSPSRDTQADPIVTTESGAARGSSVGGVLEFRGIPYAATPTGAARFRPPELHPGWQGVRDARSPGATAPQANRKGFGGLDMRPYFGPGWVRGEDSLTLNVWAPAQTAGGLPVMVFVHGGGFVSGAIDAALYDGRAFARDGVVLVTVAYRLGVTGFLDLPGAERNRGLLDVAAALEWVRRNITAFGGDPDNVTLFGQSAGATIVSGVIARRAAEGTFRRAIVQSGSGTGAFTPEQAARVTAAVADRLGVAADPIGFAGVPDEDLVEVLGSVGALDLTTSSAFDPLAGLSPIGLVLDEQPAMSIARGAADHIDLFVTTNAEEGNLYLAPQGNLTTSTDADLSIAARVHPDPEGLIAAYRRNRPAAGAGEIRAAILGDALFGDGSRRLADAHAERPGGRTWAALFSWRPDTLDGELGSAHTVELPFVFDTVDAPGVRGAGALLGEGPVPVELVDFVHGSWVLFATSGEPGWEPYTLGRRVTQILEVPPSSSGDPRRDELSAWSSR
ncbi:carboxylesterase family protein [Nocardiopsis sp. CT-R113]|uniref:Carboxylic ester hydrolase n=1 Tax=Nocardiopsis codii TaxID=3065942 RepID=A0ABU7K3Y8_9ACTN|nr:carboxylesterase family protein [Nocardiopsis sp. CT-R113]MEE2036956.1 carboxylesterase family protein [Nocardiopsis sp. CT-R113]